MSEHGDGDRTADGVVTLADIEDARERIDDVINDTPLDTSRTLAERSGAAAVGLKLENMQRTGSFKIRGAYNTMAQLPESARERGVVTSSAGNHAQGVAHAGEHLGIDTTIVVPEVTPAAKIDATRGYGADVVVHGDIYERSYERALALAEEHGYAFVHPFDDGDVIAGQGTIGLELREEFGDIDTVLVSIGGGGLIAGIATALTAHDDDIRVVGVQPEGAAHVPPSLEAGEIRELGGVDTVAEGIADTRLLERTWAVVSERVDDVVTVSDAEITCALAVLAERVKTVAEAAGAAPVAALLGDDLDITGERVAAVVSGGNTDLTEHGELVRTGLMRLGRYAEARVAVADWPHGLDALTDVIADAGAELDEVARRRLTSADHPNRTPVAVSLAGSGPAHLRETVAAVDATDGLAVVEHSIGAGGETGAGDGG
ncbi:threonine ammonia-lyase [Halarchaeum nitratireducens]|uniref:threonine ammonia-lyase n=1 Tax=Halarchaeum nitratireducens TaxID=489913 RepID=A0A830GCE3_9EURY|nr:threonine ammonia-lyase [Halarchaeum nitratireducens]GGN20830.1 threonine ammonia-lyase [Halarchaeum nitratireducens]